MGSPPGAGLDEGVQKLGDFCAALTAANDNLEQNSSVIESHAGGTDKLDEVATEQLGGLNGALESFAGDFDQAEGEAVQELEQAAATAHTLAEARLGAVRQGIEETEDDLESRLKGDGDELERKFGELSSDFQALEGTLDLAETEVVRVRTEVESAYEGFESALQTLGGELENSRSRTMQVLDQASEEIQGDEVQAFQADAAAGTAGWSDELPANLEAEGKGVGDALVAAYQAFGGDAAGAGDDLIESVATLGRESGEALLRESGSEMETAVEAVVAGDVEEVTAELDRFCGSIDEDARTAEALQPMIGELEKVELVIAAIAAAMEAME